MRRRAIVVAASVLVACVTAPSSVAEPNQGAFRKFLVGVAAAQVADNVTTQIGMTPCLDVAGKSWARGEINPLLSSDRGANAVAQVGATIATLVLLHKIEPKHPKLARVIATGLMGLGAVDSVRNLNTFVADRRGNHCGQ